MIVFIPILVALATYALIDNRYFYDALREVLSPPSPLSPPTPPRIWDIEKHQVWGNQISWFDARRRLLTGHTTPRPSRGDILLCPMKSGKIGKFRFVSVEYKSDPPDMWFSTMEQIGEGEGEGE